MIAEVNGTNAIVTATAPKFHTPVPPPSTPKSYETDFHITLGVLIGVLVLRSSGGREANVLGPQAGR